MVERKPKGENAMNIITGVTQKEMDTLRAAIYGADLVLGGLLDADEPQPTIEAIRQCHADIQASFVVADSVLATEVPPVVF